MRKLFRDCIYILFVITIMFFLSDLPSFSRPMKFAHVSDIHYSLDREDTSFKLLSKSRDLLLDAISQINSYKGIKFVMITGDVIDRPKEKDLNGVTDDLKKLKYPWYVTIGNHDTNSIKKVDKKKFWEVIQQKNSNFKFKNTYYTFVPQRGYRVIVLDGAINIGRASHGILPEEQLTWLDKTLASSKNETVLIFLHFPLVPPYESKSHEITNADDFRSVLEKYKMPIAIFSGHYHATKIKKQGNILHVSTPALISYPNSFRIVEVENKSDYVLFKFKYCETNLKELQQTAKIRVIGDALYYGKPKDRDVEIKIRKEKNE